MHGREPAGEQRGSAEYSTFIGAPNLDAARLEMETNYFGTLSMCRAFAPVLAANGGGAIVNMLSVTSFYTNPFDASYGASKAAAWSLTNGVRLELHTRAPGGPGTPAHRHRHGRAADAPKATPNQSPGRSSTPWRPARSRSSPTRTAVKAALSRDHELIYPPVQDFWDPR